MFIKKFGFEIGDELNAGKPELMLQKLLSISFEKHIENIIQNFDKNDYIFISGPMTNGGYSIVKNVNNLLDKIDEYKRKGFNVINQFEFEGLFNILLKEGVINYNDIFEKFYNKLFSSNKLKKVIFLKNYKESNGCLMEMDLCKKWRIDYEIEG